MLLLPCSSPRRHRFELGSCTRRHFAILHAARFAVLTEIDSAYRAGVSARGHADQPTELAREGALFAVADCESHLGESVARAASIRRQEPVPQPPGPVSLDKRPTEEGAAVRRGYRLVHDLGRPS
jgi:hypothetical protein